MFDLRKIAVAILALGAVSIASAQVSIDYEDNVAATADGSTLATMSVNWTNDAGVGSGGISSLQMEMTFPSGVTLAACNDGAALGGSDHVIATCDDGTSGPGSFTIAWFSFSNAFLPDGEIATLDFTVAPGTEFGTLPIGLTDLTDPNLNSMGDTSGTEITIQPGTNFNGDGGSLEVSCPANESCYSSTPAIGANVDFGSAVVGQTTANQIISVSNLQDDTTTSFDITGASGTNGGATISGTVPGGTATVPADGGATEVDVTFDCTPTARGNQTGTLAIENDSDSAGPSAGYDYTCAGESPNVQVPAGPVSLSGTLAGADPSDTITVANPQDGFTSTANNLTATAGAGDTEITVSGGPTNLAAGASFDFTVSCDSSAEGNFSRTIDFSWDDPAGPGTDSITVNCTVSDTAPIYESDPVPGTPIALSAPFGTQSAPDGLDVRNANPNPAADDLIINSATADDPVFTVTVNQTTFPANGSFDGDDEIVVTCTPEGVGTVNGTLTVETNDPNEPGAGFTYPLSCEGTGETLSTNPDDGGTLNLGTVPPDTTTGEGFINFTNNGIAGNGSVDVSCSVTDTDGVFTFNPDPIQFTIAEGDTGSAGFQCTPTDVSSFTADVSCTFSGAQTGTANFTVACAGRPLVIPTMSRWGLVVMSLMLLLVGGFATRRMMA
ncbi:MAG: IPTL-CTERM sorting domain-containing protein [Wenzhouxiangellaceae bacterium]